MKKIVRQQNYLKELIDSQENHFLSKQSLKCILRSILEPLLDSPEEGVVLHRITDVSGMAGLLKRLEFSEVDAFDFSDNGGYLVEKVWANTEFLCVLTHRFVAIIIWDSKTDNPHTVRYYSIYNSRLQYEALDIIGRNAKVNIKDFQEKFKPDRRDNILLNSSIRSLFENLDEASKDAVLGFAQVQSEKQDADTEQNVREIVHEIKNQLSICDLYTEIMKKYCLRNGIKDDSILNSLKNINKSVQIASNTLVNLKATGKTVIKPNKLKELVSTVYDLTKIYAESKNVEYITENDADVKIPVDETKFLAVLVNLVKNASEAFENEETDVRNGKYIKIRTEEDGDFAVVRISNNAGKIDEPDNIFKQGYTTKSSGNGLGLSICKKSIEEMYGKLSLEHNDDDYTEFAIRIAKVE